MTRAPDVVAPPPGHPRFPALDALRAVAALGVLVSHAAYVSGASQNAWYGSLVAQGTAGVTVFFVLSGFLLYRPFLAAGVDGLRAVHTRDYARRRLLRIVPAYWLALTVIGIWLGLTGVFGADFWRYYLFAQVYDPQTLTGGLAAAWTLCVEISFYALLPLYAMALARLGRGRGRVQRMRLELIVLAVLAAASVAARAISLSSGGSTLEVTLAGTFMWFALGMALAVWSVEADRAPRAVHAAARHPVACWAVAGAALVALAVVLHVPKDQVLAYSPGEWMFQHVVSGVLAIALVLPAVLGPGGLPRRVMSWRALGLLGLVSYGIYLWQGAWVEQLSRWDAIGWWSPFLTITLATLALTVATAAASYVLLERPLMRLKNRRLLGPPGTRRTAAGPASARGPVPDTAPGSPR